MLRTSPSSTPAIGDMVDGRFHLLQPCGEGPAGPLFDALDEVTAEVVRLRIPSGEVDARLLGVQHPSLVRHLGMTSDAGYLVMEDLDGSPLSLTEHGSASLRVYEVAAQLMPLFIELHSHGVVHENFGLHSVWRDREGHLRVVDLGIHSRLDAESTPFASPERRRGERQDARGDVYSLACLFFALAEGVAPKSNALHPETPLCYAVPAAVGKVLARAMNPRPAFRYDDAAALWADLEGPLLAAIDADVLGADDDESDATLDRLDEAVASMAPAPPRRRAPRSSWMSYAVAGGLLASSIGVSSLLLAGLGMFVWTQS